MNSKRGLTLIEVLAAVILLAVIITTCISLLRDVQFAAYNTDQTQDSIDLVTLARLADEVVLNPTEYGIESFSDIGMQMIDWPNHEAHPQVRVSKLVFSTMTQNTTIDHSWVQFACEDWIVTRWIAIEPDSQEIRGVDQ